MGEYIYDYHGLFRRGRWLRLGAEIRTLARLRGWTVPFAVGAYFLKPIPEYGWPRGLIGRLLWPLRRLHRELRPPGRGDPAWIRSELAERARLREIRQPEEMPPVRGIARRQRYASVFTPMHMRGVVWSERTAAAAGLRFADPWSDRRIAEFAVAVPQRVLNITGEEKRLTRTAMTGIMPERTRLAARKIAPRPLYRRALEVLARNTVRDLLHKAEAARRGYVDADALQAEYEAIRRGETEHPCFWYALTLEMWLRAHWT